MDAVEFLRARRKLCNDNVCEESCPLFYCCDDNTEDSHIRQVLVVKQWTKEHPVKTRQSELLKMFPNTDKNNGVLDFCPQRFGYFRGNSKCCESTTECAECKRDFWLKEIE